MGEVKVDMVRKFALALRRQANAADTDPLVAPMVMVEVTPLLAKKVASALLTVRRTKKGRAK